MCYHIHRTEEILELYFFKQVKYDTNLEMSVISVDHKMHLNDICLRFLRMPFSLLEESKFSLGNRLLCRK